MLKELLNDHQLGMSEFQDDYFVTVKSGGTLYGQYKQALRELYKRFRSLREIQCDYEKLQIEIEQYLDTYKNNKESFKGRLAFVEYKRSIMQLEELERLNKDTKREFKRFYKQGIYLKEQIGELTPQKRELLEKDMWLFKVKELICIDWVTNKNISRSTFELIHSLPQEMKSEITKVMQNQNELLEWYETKDVHINEADFTNYEIPDISTLLKLPYNG